MQLRRSSLKAELQLLEFTLCVLTLLLVMQLRRSSLKAEG
jgi:hypothetical protein